MSEASFPDKVHDLRQSVTESDWPNWWTVNKKLFFAKYSRGKDFKLTYVNILDIRNRKGFGYNDFSTMGRH